VTVLKLHGTQEGGYSMAICTFAVDINVEFISILQRCPTTFSVFFSHKQEKRE
jgi:hypothetical protein